MLPSPRQLTCAVLYIFFYGNVRTTIQVVQCDFVQSTSFQSLLGLGVCCAVLACCLSQLCLIKLFQAFFFFFLHGIHSLFLVKIPDSLQDWHEQCVSLDLDLQHFCSQCNSSWERDEPGLATCVFSAPVHSWSQERKGKAEINQWILEAS